MKAHVLESVGKIHLMEIEKPVPAKKDVVVRVMASGICGSDIARIYRTGTYSFPLIPGHEFSGVITDVGELVEDRWLGKRVGVYPLIPCNKCQPCKQGTFELCRKYSYLGSRENGGFAEFVRVPVSNIIELPQNVSYEEAAMLEPLSVAVHAMRSAKPRQEDTVAVFGVGTIGLLLCMILKEMGIEKILVIGNKRFQLENVLKLGLIEDNYCDCNSQDINQWIMQRTNQQGVDISFECVGKGITINQAIESTTPSGKIQLIGNPESDITLFKEIYWKILRNQLTVMGSWNSSFLHNELDDWHYALGLLEQNRINLKDMITHRFGYDDLKKGLEIMRDKIEEYIKVLIIFDSK